MEEEKQEESTVEVKAEEAVPVEEDRTEAADEEKEDPETVKLREELETVKEEREKAYEQVAALGKSLEESEQLIAKLRGEADKGAKTSGKEKGE